MKPKVIRLKGDRDKSVRQHHPWIFSGAIARVEGDPGSGETVDVLDEHGELLGRAAYSPVSSIRARMWTFEDVVVDGAFFERRISAALAARAGLFAAEPEMALRLVHAESDGIPGVIIDQYGGTLVLQSLTAGSDYWRDTLVEILGRLPGVESIYERSDVDVRSLEGLGERSGLVYGKALPERIRIRENGLSFWVNPARGQKTGFYLDQRGNRAMVRGMVKGRSVLNCFCYSGAFSLYALAGGAEKVVSIDSSAEALDLARENMRLNDFPEEKAEWLEADVFLALRKFRDERRSFDAIILDPPKFAPTAAQAERAARGYKDINLLAFKLLNPGGLLFTFSCSGGISADLFQKIVAGAALDAKVDGRVIGHFSQGPDHPVALNFPEGAYLKGLICQKPA